MAISEASWVKLERREGETLRTALERTLRDEILSGTLRAGVDLPASRLLAHQLGVSRGVVSEAYGQLSAQGFLISRPRGAPVVAAVPQTDTTQPAPEPAPAAAPLFDFTPTSPDVNLFPLSRWLAAADRAARQAGHAALGYRDSAGELALRELLAGHLGRTRGVIADPSQLTVVQGTAQGIDVVARLMKERGISRIAVEDPSHTTQVERFRAMGLEVVPCPVDGDGIIIEGVEADAALVTPAHQFPLGVVLSSARRRELVAWARDGGRLLIEDDYDSEFRYDRDGVRALQGLAPECVVYIGTVSKTMAPSLRLGWIVAPPALAPEMTALKRLIDDFTPILDQLALAEFMRRGDYDRHVRRARSTYHGRRDRFLAALQRSLPELWVGGVAAGVHLVLCLPDGVCDVKIAEAAAKARIGIYSLSKYRIASRGRGGLVLGYGRMHQDAIAAATEALAEIVRPHLAAAHQGAA